MRRFKVKNVEEDDTDHLKPEIIIVSESCRHEKRFSGETSCSGLTNMVSSGSEKSFAGSDFSSSKLALKEEYTAGDACATACSSYLHYEQVAPMGTKVERFIGEASKAKFCNRSSDNHANLFSPLADNTSEGRHHTSSDTSHLISACSSHGSFSENEEGEEALRDSCSGEASPNWGSPKAPIFCDNCNLDQGGRQRALECLGDNISCISELNHAKIRDGDVNGESDRKNVSCCSSSANSISEGEKAFDNQPCCLSDSPFGNADTNHRRKLNVSPKDSFVSTSLLKEEQSECSEEQVQSLLARENGTMSGKPINSLMGDKRRSAGSLQVESGNNREQSAEAGKQSTNSDHLKKMPGKPIKEAQIEKTIIEYVPADCGDGSGVLEIDVKVCDICGDVGREYALAICSKCTDGAEHIYCMRVKLDKVPIGDWMCEECALSEGTERKEQDDIEKRAEPLKKLSTNVLRQSSQNSSAIHSKNNLQSDARGSGFEKIRAHKIYSHSLCAKSPPAGVEAISVRKRLLESSMSSHDSKRLKQLSRGQSSGHDVGTAQIPSTPRGKSSLLPLQSQMVQGSLSKSKSFSIASPKGSLYKSKSFPNTSPKGSLCKTKPFPDTSPKGSLTKSKSFHSNSSNGYLSNSKSFPDTSSKGCLSKTKSFPSTSSKEKVQQSREGNGLMLDFARDNEKYKSKEGVVRSMIKSSSNNAMPDRYKARLDLKTSPSKFSSGRDLKKVKCAIRHPVTIMKKMPTSAVNNPAASMVDGKITASGKPSLAESPRTSFQDLPSEKSRLKSNNAVESSSRLDLPSEKSRLKLNNAVESSGHQDLPSEKSRLKSKNVLDSSSHQDLPSEKSRLKLNNAVESSGHQDLPSEKSRLKSKNAVEFSSHQDLASEKRRLKSNNAVESSSHQDLASEKRRLKSNNAVEPSSRPDLPSEKSCLKSNNAVDSSSHQDLKSEKRRLESNNAVDSSSHQDLKSEKRRLESKNAVKSSGHEDLLSEKSRLESDNAVESSSHLTQRCISTEMRNDCVNDGKDHVEHSADVAPAIKTSHIKAAVGESAFLRNAAVVAFLRDNDAPNSAIPEPFATWQGRFDISRCDKQTLSCYGLQAHKSCRASHKVLDVVKKLPRKLQLAEMPRLSSWPDQFVRSRPSEDNIALYFFAKDLESYNKSYKNLVNCMMKKDLCLKGNFEGFELLVFSSNLLPEEAQSFNSLFFLWGVFKGKKPHCSDNLPSCPGASTSSMKEEVAHQGMSAPAVPPSGNMLSAGRSNESFPDNIQQTINSVTSVEVPALASDKKVEISETKITSPEHKPSDLQAISGRDVDLVDVEMKTELADDVPCTDSTQVIEISETIITSPEQQSADSQTITGRDVAIVDVQMYTELAGDVTCTNSTQQEKGELNAKRGLEIDLNDSLQGKEDGDEHPRKKLKRPIDETAEESNCLKDAKNLNCGDSRGIDRQGSPVPSDAALKMAASPADIVPETDQNRMVYMPPQQQFTGVSIDLNMIVDADHDMPGSSAVIDLESDPNMPHQQFPATSFDLNKIDDTAHDMPESDPNKSTYMPHQQFAGMLIDLNKIDDTAHDMPGSSSGINLETERRNKFEAMLEQARAAQAKHQLQSLFPEPDLSLGRPNAASATQLSLALPSSYPKWFGNFPKQP